MPITIKKRTTGWIVTITHKNINISYHHYNSDKAEAESNANKILSNAITILDTLQPHHPNAYIDGGTFYIIIHANSLPYETPVPSFLRLTDPAKLAQHAHSVLTHKIDEKQIILDFLASRLQSISTPADLRGLFCLTKPNKEHHKLTAFTTPNKFEDYISIEFINYGTLYFKNKYHSIPHIDIRIIKPLSAFEILHYDDALTEILAYTFKPIQIAKMLSTALPLLFPHPLPSITISSDLYYLITNAQRRDYQQPNSNFTHYKSISVHIPNDRFVQTPADDLAGELIQDLIALL